MGIQSVTHDPIFYFSFNAVFHAVTQVFLGKELLIDLQHQYGLYPHFIEPIFRLTGLSVVTFSLIMSALLVIALSCIWRTTRDLCGNRLLAALGLLSIAYFCYFFGRLNFLHDLYYQYHPIRFLFPALAIALTSAWLKSGSRRIYYLSFVTAAIAILWNFDTGFVVFASWLLLLLYQESSDLALGKMMRHLATGMVILAAVTGCFFGYLFVKYGQAPDLPLLFNYQKLFYLYGYMMLPMPLWHPWNAVVLIYAIGLLYSLASLIDRDVTPFHAMIFFLSIMGFGLFSYYQGRSHNLNLPPVSYPAIMLLAAYGRILMQRIQRGNAIGDRILLWCILFFMCYAVASLLKNTPLITRTIHTRLTPVVTDATTAVSQCADFIRRTTKAGDDVLFLSLHSGIYSLAAQQPVSLKIPGTTELSLRDEYDRLLEYLAAPGPKKVFIDRSFDISPYRDTVMGLLATHFRLADASPDGLLALYVK